VRVIAATNRHLPHEIASGGFRQDLFYRIAVLTISTPPLRDHAADVPLLVEHFLRESAKSMKRTSPPGIEPDAVKTLSHYTWPGNVRQLQHVMQRLIATHSNGHRINAAEVQEALKDVSLLNIGPQVPMVFRDDDSLEVFVSRVTVGLYNHFRALGGSHAKAARLLRIDRNALYKRLKRARRRLNGQEVVDEEEESLY
jgi:two-component system, NtrC family, response regulator HydG